MRSAFRGPAHQLLAVRMRINIIAPRAIIIIMAQATSHHAPATACAPRVCTLVPFIITIIFLVEKYSISHAIRTKWQMKKMNRSTGTCAPEFMVVYA